MQRSLTRLFVVRYGIADVTIADAFDTGGNVTDLTGIKSFRLGHFG